MSRACLCPRVGFWTKIGRSPDLERGPGLGGGPGLGRGPGLGEVRVWVQRSREGVIRAEREATGPDATSRALGETERSCHWVEVQGALGSSE